MPDIPNNFFRTSIKALIFDDQKRFMLVRKNTGLWDIPGGGLSFGEKIHDCIRRELKEEMGLEVEYIDKQPSYFVTGKTITNIWKSCAIYVTKVRDLDFTPSEECREIRFVTKSEALMMELYPTVKEFLNELP